MKITLFIEDIVKGVDIHETEAACVPTIGECVGGWDGFTYEITGVKHELRGTHHIATLYVKQR